MYIEQVEIMDYMFKKKSCPCARHEVVRSVGILPLILNFI